MSRSKDSPYHHGDLKRTLVDAALRILESHGPAELTFRRLAKDVHVSHAAPLAHFPDRLSLDAAIASRGFRQLDSTLAAIGGVAPGPVAPAAPALQAPVPAAPVIPFQRAIPRPRLLSFAADRPGSVPMAAASFREPSPEPSRLAARLVALALAYLGFALERPGLYRAMVDPELARRLAGLMEGDETSDAEFLELAQGKDEVFQRFVALVQAGQRGGEFRADLPAEQIARLFLGLAEGLAQQYIEEKPGARGERLKEAKQLFELQLRAVVLSG